MSFCLPKHLRADLPTFLPWVHLKRPQSCVHSCAWWAGEKESSARCQVSRQITLFHQPQYCCICAVQSVQSERGPRSTHNCLNIGSDIGHVSVRPNSWSTVRSDAIQRCKLWFVQQRVRGSTPAAAWHYALAHSACSATMGPCLGPANLLSSRVTATFHVLRRCLHSFLNLAPNQ